jgi:hypothetical protein
MLLYMHISMNLQYFLHALFIVLKIIYEIIILNNEYTFFLILSVSWNSHTKISIKKLPFD